MQKNTNELPLISQGSRRAAFFELNVLVFIFGVANIFRRFIDLSPEALSIYRTFITFLCLLIYMLIRRKSFSVSPKLFITLVLTGGVIGIHWALFFKAIDESNISISVAMLSTGAIFASFLEPIFFKRKIRAYEVLFSLLAVGGVCVIIFEKGFNFHWGAMLALAASFLSVIYSMLNAKLSNKYPGRTTLISCYEMLGAAVVVAFVYSFTGSSFIDNMQAISWKSLWLVLVLAIFATSYTNVATIRLFQKLTPYNVLLNINLEPVYSMVLAIIIWPEQETMSLRFYIGSAIIILSVVASAIISKPKQNGTESK